MPSAAHRLRDIASAYSFASNSELQDPEENDITDRESSDISNRYIFLTTPDGHCVRWQKIKQYGLLCIGEDPDKDCLDQMSAGKKNGLFSYGSLNREFPGYHQPHQIIGRTIILSSLPFLNFIGTIHMARIKILLPEHFSFSCSIPIRITDLNYGNHVGNDTVCRSFMKQGAIPAKLRIQ